MLHEPHCNVQELKPSRKKLSLESFVSDAGFSFLTCRLLQRTLRTSFVPAFERNKTSLEQRFFPLKKVGSVLRVKRDEQRRGREKVGRMRGAIFSLMQRSSVRYDVSRAPRRAFLKAQPATAARDDEKCTHDRMRRVCISVQWTCSRGKPDFPVAPIHVLWFPRDACTPGCPLLYYQTAGYRFTSESSNYLSAAIETR